MDTIALNFLANNNNIIFNEDDKKNFNEDNISNKSFDEETIPDEDFNKKSNKKRSKNSCPNMEHKGPNINLKIEHKRFSNQKEKEFFFEKIKRKKKTELCKNYELYHDCYYGDTCCFAHGIDELRDNILLPSYKTKMCKSFMENKTCNFGIRCSYQHKIK
jgi:butyrate response factor 1